MNITPAELFAQVDSFTAAYPFVWLVEAKYSLPRGLLLAVGSRETNLVDEIGDGGHGHGVWQLDDRSHVIPVPFPVTEQADVAAAMLAAELIAQANNIDRAACVYNSGQPYDSGTTGGNYGLDVEYRQSLIAAHYPAPREGDKDMDIITCTAPGHADFLRAGSKLVSIPDQTKLEALIANGVPVKPYDPVTYAWLTTSLA